MVSSEAGTALLDWAGM